MTLRAAVAAACVFAAGCGPTVHTVGPQHGSYRPQMIQAFEGGKLPLFFAGGDAGEAARFADAMSGWRNGVKLAFVPDGDTGASFGYRVVVRLEGRPGRIQDLCHPDVPLAVAEDDTLYANFAFCRGRTPITTAVTALPDLADPAFAEHVKAAMRTLFPKVKDDRRDGGKIYLL